VPRQTLTESTALKVVRRASGFTYTFFVVMRSPPCRMLGRVWPGCGIEGAHPGSEACHGSVAQPGELSTERSHLAFTLIRSGSCPQREEPAGSRGVLAGREQHVNDLTVLVDGAVDVAPDPVDLDGWVGRAARRLLCRSFPCGLASGH
jgi:hypothetical protein